MRQFNWKYFFIAAKGNQLKYLQFEGIDYAFYKGDRKKSVGYLRFQPNQLKCEKCTKYFELVNIY